MKLTIQSLAQDGSLVEEDMIEVSGGNMLVMQVIDKDVTIQTLSLAFDNLRRGLDNMEESNGEGVGAIGLPYGVSLKVVRVEDESK